MKLRTIHGIILILLLGLCGFAQDIKVEVVKEKYRVIPLFAVSDSGEAITDLEKTDVEFLLNGQNSREFLLFKKAFSRIGTNDSTNEIYSEAPGLKRGKVIILLFDTLFANKKTLNLFAAVARRIVLGTGDRIKFAVLTTTGTAVAFSTMKPKRDKNAVLRDIKDKAVTGAGYMYNPDVKMKLFAQSFEKLYRPLKGMNDNKVLYIFSPAMPKGEWRDCSDRAARYLEQINGVLVFINPAHSTTGGGKNFIESLANTSGGKYIAGSKDEMIKKIENLHHSYYEIIIPGLKEFKGSLRQIQISSTRKHVTLQTAKGVAKIRGKDVAAKPAAPRQPVPQKPGPENGDRKIEVKDRTAAIRSAVEERVNKLLTTARSDVNRTDTQLFCSKALLLLKQGRLLDTLKQLKKILESNEPKTGLIRQAVAELDKRLESEHKIENLLKSVARFRMQSNHREVLKFHERINRVTDDDLKPITGDDIVTLFENLEKILTHVRKEMDSVGAALSQLSDVLVFDQKEVFNPDYSKAENYRRILEAFENISPGDSTANDTRNVIKKIITHLKNAAIEAGIHVDFVKYILEKIAGIDAGSCDIFVILNNDQFALNYKKPFFKNKLLSLGAGPALINNPDFIDVVSHTIRFSKNSKGFWEATSYNDTVLIYIPAGKFTMGLPWESGGGQDESPQHEVFLSGYWIAKFETTFRQYDLFCESLGRGKPADSDFGRKDHPVINISWDDMDDYCKWLSGKTDLHFRLPTEAEWEKAARGTAGWKYPWGNAKPDGKKANFADRTLLENYKRNHPGEAIKGRLEWMDKKAKDGYRATAPVGKYPGGASPYGVMDMAGNVWEFTWDWYDGDYYQRSPEKNPPGSYQTGYKSIRGGGWDSHHWMLRSTTRAGGVPGKAADVVGFRVAVGKRFDKNN